MICLKLYEWGYGSRTEGRVTWGVNCCSLGLGGICIGVGHLFMVWHDRGLSVDNCSEDLGDVGRRVGTEVSSTSLSIVHEGVNVGVERAGSGVEGNTGSGLDSWTGLVEYRAGIDTGKWTVGRAGRWGNNFLA